jgi:hypothetical protein
MPPDGDPYLYPGTTTLKNKLGIRDPKALERAEDERAAAPTPSSSATCRSRRLPSRL